MSVIIYAPIAIQLPVKLRRDNEVVIKALVLLELEGRKGERPYVI